MADGSPCPTCQFLVPEGAERCPQCGRVFGEANRCPHCHAVAAARPTASGYVCGACGKPRALQPGTTLTRGSIAPSAATPPRRRGLRFLAGMLLAAAVLGAAASTAVLGTGLLGIAVAVGIAMAGAGAGVRLLRRASTLDREVDEARVAARMQAAKQLLLERGPLTVPELAAKLGTSEPEADAIASRLAADDATGVSAEVDETVGLLRFGKRRELVAHTRVEDPDRGGNATTDDDVADAADVEERADAEAASASGPGEREARHGEPR
jgi:hypothetical protein